MKRFAVSIDQARLALRTGTIAPVTRAALLARVDELSPASKQVLADLELAIAQDRVKVL